MTTSVGTAAAPSGLRCLMSDCKQHTKGPTRDLLCRRQIGCQTCFLVQGTFRLLQCSCEHDQASAGSCLCAPPADVSGSRKLSTTLRKQCSRQQMLSWSKWSLCLLGGEFVVLYRTLSNPLRVCLRPLESESPWRCLYLVVCRKLLNARASSTCSLQVLLQICPHLQQPDHVQPPVSNFEV